VVVVDMADQSGFDARNLADHLESETTLDVQKEKTIAPGIPRATNMVD